MRRLRLRPRRKAATLEVVHPDCAGIDIGQKAHYVGVDPARFDEPVRNYGTSTAEPRVPLAQDLPGRSTGAYEKPLAARSRWWECCGIGKRLAVSAGAHKRT